MAHSVRPRVWLALLTLVTIGCQGSPPITKIEAPKSPAVNRPDRMLGAVMLRESVAWFFKISGDRASIEKIDKDFQATLASVTFGEDGNPQWKSPESWVRRGVGGSIRFATLEIPVDGKKLEMTITQLPYAAEDPDRYILKNYNRWRDQMGQRDLYSLEMERESEQFKTAGGLVGSLVRIDGRMMADGMSAPFMSGAMGGAGAGGPSNEPPPAKPTPPTEKIAVDVPEHWKPGRLNQFRLEAYQVSEGAKLIEVTISTAGGEALPNVNRWRDQVGLQHVTQAQLDAEAKDVKAGQLSGKYFELVGKDKTILAVMAPDGGQTYFIKLAGDNELAAKEKKNFATFFGSLKLP